MDHLTRLIQSQKTLFPAKRQNEQASALFAARSVLSISVGTFGVIAFLRRDFVSLSINITSS